MTNYTTLPDLTWHVYISDFNRKIIVEHNIFNHGGFVEDCRKAYKKHSEDRDAFLSEVRRSLMYWYWSKCEWEVVIDHWPHRDNADGAKVDVFDQVTLNWPAFCDYIWTNRDKFKVKRSRKK